MPPLDPVAIPGAALPASPRLAPRALPPRALPPRVVPLETGIALAAADACRDHGLATADAILLATARDHGARLLTCDTRFRGLAGVQLIETRT